MIEELRIHQIELEIQNEELRRAQQEADDARRRYFRLFEFAPVGYLIVRPDGKILSANLTTCDLTGLDRTSLMRAGLFGLVEQGDRPALIELLREVTTNGGRRVSADVRLEGESAPYVRVEAVRHDGDDRLPQEIQISVTDVTRQREAEERARAAADHNYLLLRELNHRVKNNLQLLLSLVTLQRNRSRDEAASEALGAVEERLRAVTFSHETLRPGAASGGVDLTELLDTLVRQSKAHHGVEATFTPRIERVIVDGDTALSVALAVNELLSNSIKYAGRAHARTSIEVTLSAPRQEGNGSRPIRVEVADDGPGLPEAYLSHSGPDNGTGTGTESVAGTPGPGSSRTPEEGGLGFVLVRQLIEDQLKGTWIRRNAVAGGAHHIIELEV
ncbi:MAG: sensor histidine kinase [Spirochaetota bacterium]